MDPEHLQASAARDQFWSSMRQLLPDIERISQGQITGNERDLQIFVLLAKVVVAELRFRDQDNAVEENK
jgi:hypothetical protein